MIEIPGPPPASWTDPPRGPWCDDCRFLLVDADTGRTYCNEADWAGWVDDTKRPTCGGYARLSRRASPGGDREGTR